MLLAARLQPELPDAAAELVAVDASRAVVIPPAEQVDDPRRPLGEVVAMHLAKHGQLEDTPEASEICARGEGLSRGDEEPQPERDLALQHA